MGVAALLPLPLGRRAPPVVQQQCKQHARLWCSDGPLRLGPPLQVSPVKLSIRQKAKRALLRYTAAAIQARGAPCQQRQLAASLRLPPVERTTAASPTCSRARPDFSRAEA